MRKLLINMRRYLIFINFQKPNLWINFSWIHLVFYPLKSVTRNRNGNLLNQYIFWINSSWVHLVDISSPEKNWVKENRPYMLGCTEKKYVPINSIQRCLGIYYLFYDIFVMNVIHRTINNNKTGRVFVFFQKGHAIFQLVFGDFIIFFFFCTRCFC